MATTTKIQFSHDNDVRFIELYFFTKKNRREGCLAEQLRGTVYNHENLLNRSHKKKYIPMNDQANQTFFHSLNRTKLLKQKKR